MYHANTSGSAASNISFSIAISSMNRAGTSVRHGSTFSVIPSLSIMIISAPASRNRFVSAIAQLGSRVPSACNSAVAVAPPAPNCIPTSGLGFIPDLRINSISRSQSSVGMETKPAEISTMSNPSRLHSATYFLTASAPCARTRSMKPPVETSTSYLWQSSTISRTAFFGMRVKEPPANFSESMYAPIVSKRSLRWRRP